MVFRKRFKNKDPSKYTWECQYQYKTESGKYKTFNVSVQEFRQINLEDPLARDDFKKQYFSKTELAKLHARRLTRKRIGNRQKQERPTNYLLDIFYQNRKHMTTVSSQIYNVNEILTEFCFAYGCYELDGLGKKIRILQNWLISRPNTKSISTVNNKIADFNQFLRILYEEGKLETLIWIPPVTKKRYPEMAGKRKGIEVVISEEIESQLRNNLIERYRLQFDVMIGLGLRLCEPNRLHLSDVYLNAAQDDFPDLFRALGGASIKTFGVIDVKHQLNRNTYSETKAKTVVR